MKQKISLKKAKIGKVLSPRKLEKFIDGGDIVMKIEEFKRTLQNFDESIETFNQKFENNLLKSNQSSVNSSYQEKKVTRRDTAIQTSQQFQKVIDVNVEELSF